LRLLYSPSGTSTLSKFGNGWRENGEHYTILSLG
jgi:hypothetical protein